MLQLSGISKSYGAQPVLRSVSFTLSPGERAGLVGPNGSGKTTLLRIIAGLEPADEGSVRLSPPTLAVGYLRQALAFAPEDSVREALDRATGSHGRAQAQMERLAEAMAGTTDPGEALRLTEQYAQAEERFQAAGGYELRARLEAAKAGLGLADLPDNLPVAVLSGGQKTRLGLAGLLATRPALLLLDEPTNHLDVEALAWLEQWLQAYDGGALIVSHDRTFLDATTTQTLVLDPADQSLTVYDGGYSDYVRAREREVEQQWQAYLAQQDEIARLRRAANRVRGLAVQRKGGKGDSGDKFAKGFFSDQSAGTVARAKALERRIERLLTVERVEKPGQQWQMKLDLARDDGGAREVLRLEDVWLSFGDLHLLRAVHATLTHGKRAVLQGPNGSGKTTLLRLIVGEMEPDRGVVRLGANVRLGYLAQEQETLDPEATPYELVRAEAAGMTETEVRAFLHRFLFTGDDVFVPVGSLSFGERARLMLAQLVGRGCNFLVLDEPVNHLDIPSRERFEEALLQFPGTVLAVVHDRAFVKKVATEVWELREGRLRVTRWAT
ncbi:MAG: ABC-F family ATP-binding cassette domain-containing protein [Anaerolineae bacterium]|nr:ABC-F family ATP-binding cassette domain-containing protein [Anaerolineae bacterium]